MTDLIINYNLPRKNPSESQIIQDMLYKALAFFQAGSRCNLNINLSPSVTNSLSDPAIVCYAFAIEMYLKTLIMISGQKYKQIHKLDELYSTLPQDTRNIIEKFGGGTIEKELSNIASAFVDYRYDFENVDFRSITISNMHNICTILHQVIRQLRSELLVTYENALPGN